MKRVQLWSKLIGLALFCVGSLGLASSSPFNGWYIGGGGVVLNGTEKTKDQENEMVFSNDTRTLLMLEKFTLQPGKANAIGAHLFGGVGHVFSLPFASFYAGSELGASFHPIEWTSTLCLRALPEDNLHQTLVATKKNTYSLELTGRLGYLSTPETLIYALAGFQRSSWKLDARAQSIDQVDSLDFTFQTKRTLNSPLLGLGIETTSGDLSVRAQFAQSTTPLWGEAGSYSAPEIPTLSAKIKSKAQQQVVTLDFVRHLNHQAESPGPALLTDENSSPFDGAYVFGGGLFSNLSGQGTASIEYQAIPSYHDAVGLSNLTLPSSGWAVASGFGTVFSFGKAYASIEALYRKAPSNGVGINVSKEIENTYFIDRIVSIHDQYLTLSRNQSYGANARIGYLPSPGTVLYLLGGMEGTHFNFGMSRTYTSLIDGVSNEIHYTSSGISRYAFGFLAGAGVEAALTNHLAVRAEYACTFYQGVSDIQSGSWTVWNNTENASFSLSSLTSSAMTLGLSLHF